jgi:hypothetical protein
MAQGWPSILRRKGSIMDSVNTDWTTSSIAAQRGLGWKGRPKTHELTEARQGRFHYTIGPYSDPVLAVRSGDRIIVETRDAFEGALKSEQDKPTEKLQMPFVNPQNGPIMIEGAKKGDAVAVLFIGDAHACQGDGEVCGIAVEYPTVTTIRVGSGMPPPSLAGLILSCPMSARWRSAMTRRPGAPSSKPT